MRQALLNAFHFRHACKLFDRTRSLPPGDLGYILEAGRLSPSSMGLEHWRFIAVQDNDLKTRLQAACMDQPQVGSASTIIAILARISDLAPDSPYVRTMLAHEVPPGQLEEFLAFYRSFSEDLDLACWSIAQCHIAAANMMTAAAAIGVDSCPIGAFDAESVRTVLDISRERFEIALLLPLGYRVNTPPPKHRLPLDELVEYR
jgi:nitroreductase